MHEKEHGFRAEERANATSAEEDLATRSRHASTLRAPAHPIASGLLMRKAEHDHVSDDAESAVAAAGMSSGDALPVDLKQRFESSLGVDLGGVRVHTDQSSANAAASVGALAFALGSNIHFARGQYDPSSASGRQLIAHEVAHTVQQGSSPKVQHKLAVSGPQDDFEQEADRAAVAMVAGSRFSLTTGSGVLVARKPEDKPHQHLEEMVGKTNGDPTAAAKLLRDNPALRSQLLDVMRAELGDEVVQQTLRELRGGSADEESDATIAAIDAKCSTAKASVVAKTSASAQAIRAAVQTANVAAIKSASEGAAAAIDEAELAALASRDELDNLDEESRNKKEWAKSDAACKDLEKSAVAQASAVLTALSLAGERAKATATSGESLATDIRARIELWANRVKGVTGLVDATLAAGKQHGKPRFEGAQQVRTVLVGLETVQRTYALTIIKQRGAAKDIVDFYEGNGDALRKEGGSLEVGNGGNSGAEAGKQGAFSASPAPLKIPEHKYAVKADASTGELGDSTEWELGKKKEGPTGTANAGASIDVRADDGSFRFEGAKFEAGYAMKGEPTVKMNGGYTQTTTPPTYDGKNWIVAWTVTASGGLGRGKSSEAFESKTGGKLSGDLKASGSLVKGGSKVFPDPASAEAYYKEGATELKKLSISLPDAAQVAGMKEGETSTLGHSGDLSAGASGGSAGISIGAMASVGGGQDVKLTKAANNKLVVTFRDTTQKGATGSVGTTGVSGSAGGGTAQAESTTAEFDLGTPEGTAAYATWSATPSRPPAAGAGVRILSRGKGDFASTNIGVGVGVSGLNGSGSTTATTGSFTETTADGKHDQTTVVGSNSDTVKDFNPITPDKKARTDALEITTTDGDTANSTYVMKTSIQGQADAKWTNNELGKVMGEPSSAGQSLDGQKASGTTGKWTVEGAYTKQQIDDFLSKVASGAINLKQHPGAAELKQTLQDPKLGDQAKQAALAKWFSQRGAEAAGDMRNALGPPAMNVTLDGDKYLTGTAGASAFEGKRVALEDRFLDPKLEGAKIKDLLRDVQALYVEQLERRDHIANPTKYPELPNALRHELVKQAAAGYEKVRLLRNRVAERAKEAGLGDPGSNTRLDQQMGEMAKARANASTLRSHSVDRRAKHGGALSAGIDSPRKELTGITGVGTAKINELYAKADHAWLEGIKQMTNAEEKERVVYKEDCLDQTSQATAVRQAGAAIDGYHDAQKRFAECISCLDTIHQQAMKYPTPTTPKSMWNGYGGETGEPGAPVKPAVFYGPLD